MPAITLPDERRIKAKVAARAAAREVLPLLEWQDGTGADYAEAFLAEMRKLLPKRREQPKEAPKPFAQLAAHVLEFGRYKGERLGQIPDEYLDWLCGNMEDTLAALRSYLKHPENRRED